MSRFDDVETAIQQSMTVIRRTAGATSSSYGDEVYSVASYTTTGFFQFVISTGGKYGIEQTDSGHELAYDAKVWLGSDSTVVEDRSIRFNNIRYRVVQAMPWSEGTSIDHYQFLVKREVR